MSTEAFEDFYFRVCTRDQNQGRAGAQFAAKTLGFKKVYIVDDNETYGKGLADVAVGDGTARHDPKRLAEAYATVLGDGRITPWR